jgi:prefoldin alpha subunit
MTKDEELTRYMTLIEQYKEQMNSLETQSSYLQAAVADYNKAKITIENLCKTSKGEEILLPIGGSTFIRAASIDSSQVLFDIGAGVVTEKSSEDAIKNIDKRIEDLQKTQERLVEMMQNLQNEAAEISQKAQQLISEGKK